VQPDNRPSLRSGLTAYVALSPGSDALLPPSPREIVDMRDPVGPRTPPRRLDASLRAPGPHDFAVRRPRCRTRARWSLTGTTRPATASGANTARVHRNSPHEPW